MDDVRGMLQHPRTLAIFSDSGAHVCQDIESSLQTHLLSYWVRDKQAFTLKISPEAPGVSCKKPKALPPPSSMAG
jgi:N-acyl-D-aspartate/D-glutamate deacylase